MRECTRRNYIYPQGWIKRKMTTVHGLHDNPRNDGDPLEL